MSASGAGARRPRVVLLTGEPGSGKTGLGLELARALHVPFLARDQVRRGLYLTASSAPTPEEAVEAFLTIVEEGSFSAAARRLGITQPSVSEQVRALEDHFGQPLFVRPARNARLTVAGQRVREQATRVVLALETGEVTLRPGDLIVDRGVIHGWRNDGAVPAVFASVTIPAKPVGAGRTV